jgi:hypothetical protein
MSKSDTTCINCDRTEAQAPLSTWSFQGRQLRVCPECMPVFIHHRDTLMAKLSAADGEDAQSSGANPDA